MYLVEIVEQDPYRLNLESVYSIDNKERVLQKEEVQRATEETDPTLITLRIRCVLATPDDGNRQKLFGTLTFAYLIMWSEGGGILDGGRCDCSPECSQA